MPFVMKAKAPKKDKPKPIPPKERKETLQKKMVIETTKELRKGRKPDPKPLKVVEVVNFTKPTPVAPVEERLPLDPTKLKWNTQDGALILVALSFLGHVMSKKEKMEGFDRFMYASKCEALGLPIGTREFDPDHLEEVTKKVFHIYAKGKDPAKVSHGVYNLVFYPQFRGGFLYPDMGKQGV